MKLRIRGNTIRLRLTRGEVERIGAGETVEEITALSGQTRFRYSLGTSTGVLLEAGMSGNHLAITAPAAALSAWASSDAVALQCELAAEGPDILVEKDFACLSPREGSDDEDTFPHPESGSRTC